MTASTGTLQVCDACLYYEAFGTGPLLVLIPGAAGTGIVYSTIASYLSSRFRVVTYDRRGFFRSPISDSATKATLDTIFIINAHDTAALIWHLSPKEPVFVFGSSGGALIAIQLLTLYPALVKGVVLHEPMLISLLRPSKQKTVHEESSKVMEAYRTSGTAAASHIFLRMISNDIELKAVKQSSVQKQLAPLADKGMSYFLDIEFEAVLRYSFMPEQLQRHKEKIHLGKGADSNRELIIYPVGVISQHLERPVTSFVGGHTGYITDGRQFAKTLVTLLCGERSYL
jgi:pimeloyl-ACP methyl ester carboxylesterase